MHPALSYAENELGVHKVHQDAQQLLSQLDEQMGALDSAVDSRRFYDGAIESRKLDLLIEERAKVPDITQAAMDRRIKEVCHKDEKLKELSAKQLAAQGQASGLEFDVEMTKYRLKVAVARMEELGGMLNYLAAVKNAEPPPVQYAEAGTSGQPEAVSGETNETNTGVPQ